MKCKIKSSGEIVDVFGWSFDGSYTNYIDENGIRTSSELNYYNEFEPVVEDNIDWEKRRYEIAKALLQGILSNSTIDITIINSKDYSDMACDFADDLIKQLKSKW